MIDALEACLLIKMASQGIIEIEKALKMANDVSLDLVQVSPSDANPIVCKLLDYGKYLFDKKSISSSSKNQKLL